MHSIYSLDTDEEVLREPFHPSKMTERKNARITELEKLAKQTRTRIKVLEDYTHQLDDQKESIDEEIKATVDNVWRRRRNHHVSSSRSTPQWWANIDYLNVRDTELREDDVFYRRIGSTWNNVLLAACKDPVSAGYKTLVTSPPPEFPDCGELTRDVKLDLDYLFMLPEFRHWNDDKDGGNFFSCDIKLLRSGMISLVDLFRRGAVNASWYERVYSGFRALIPEDYRGERFGEECRNWESSRVKSAAYQRMAGTTTPRASSAHPVSQADDRHFPTHTPSLNNGHRHASGAQAHGFNRAPDTPASPQNVRATNVSQPSINRIKEDLDELVRLVAEYEILYKSAQAEAERFRDSGEDDGNRGVELNGNGKGKERARDV